MGAARRKTRYKDKNGRMICFGDILHVEEYSDRFVGGSYGFEGVVEWDYNSNHVVVSYYDIGESEFVPLNVFPVQGREIIGRANDGSGEEDKKKADSARRQ